MPISSLAFPVSFTALAVFKLNLWYYGGFTQRQTRRKKRSWKASLLVRFLYSGKLEVTVGRHWEKEVSQDKEESLRVTGGHGWGRTELSIQCRDTAVIRVERRASQVTS